MSADPDLATVALLIADRSRAATLTALLGGEGLPARELARQAGVGAPTASVHLARLTRGGLVRVEQAGRQRIFRLSGAPVARALEALALIAPESAASTTKAAYHLRTIRDARTCYAHLAGVLGVAVTQALLERHYLRHRDGAFDVGAVGVSWFNELGIDCDELRTQHRVFARSCLDWSERRPHLAGALGAALTTRFFELGWIARIDRSRAITVTATGRRALRRELEVGGR